MRIEIILIFEWYEGKLIVNKSKSLRSEEDYVDISMFDFRINIFVKLYRR